MADRTAKQGLADLREEGKRVEGEIRELRLCLRTFVCEVKGGGALVTCQEGCTARLPSDNLFHFRQALTP